MPMINLIKEQRLVAQKRERQVQMAVMGTLGVGALCLIATAGLMLDAARLNIQAAVLEKQQKDLEPMLAELDKNKGAIDLMQPRIKTLKEAQETTGKWEKILEHLTTNTPEGTWLTSFKSFQQDKTKPMKVSLIGISKTQDLVGELILRLEMCPELQDVSLKFTQPRFSEKGNRLDFELEASVAGTGDKDEKPKEVKG